MKHKPFLLLLLIIALTACSTFIPEEESDRLKLINQSGEYVLVDKIERNGIILEKNTTVNLVVVTSDEWVKVYAYRSAEGLLASNRIIILYMFESDFPDKKFKRDLFNKELEKIVIPKTASMKDKEVKKTKKRKG